MGVCMQILSSVDQFESRFGPWTQFQFGPNLVEGQFQIGKMPGTMQEHNMFLHTLVSQIARAFLFTARYIDDLLSITNPYLHRLMYCDQYYQHLRIVGIYPRTLCVTTAASGNAVNYMDVNVQLWTSLQKATRWRQAANEVWLTMSRALRRSKISLILRKALYQKHKGTSCLRFFTVVSSAMMLNFRPPTAHPRLCTAL